MGTENDRFAQSLGRRFRRIWGGLAAGHDVTDRLATYMLQTFTRDDAEIGEFCRGRMKALNAYDGLLLRDLGLDDNLLEHEGNRSHAAMHAADAYRDAVIQRAGPESYPLFVARRLFDAVASLAQIHQPYSKEIETLGRLQTQRDAVVARLSNRLKKQLGLPSERATRSSTVILDQRVPLDSPIGYIA